LPTPHAAGTGLVFTSSAPKTTPVRMVEVTKVLFHCFLLLGYGNRCWDEEENLSEGMHDFKSKRRIWPKGSGLTFPCVGMRL
jgi:hypothetical protein